MLRDAKKREFPFTRHRQENGTRHYFGVTCHQCQHRDSVTSSAELPDQVVRKKFQQKGWLLGRTRESDWCPDCLKIGPENRLADRFKVTDGKTGQTVPSAQDKLRLAAEEQFQRTARTDDLLTRFMTPSREDTAPETPMSAAPQQVIVQQGLSLQQTIDLTTALTGINKNVGAMASEIGNLSAAVQLLAEQNASLLTHLHKQTNAIAQIVPAFARSSEGIAGSLQELRETITNLPLMRAPELPAAPPPPEPAAPPCAAVPLSVLAGQDFVVEEVTVETSQEVARTGKPTAGLEPDQVTVSNYTSKGKFYTNIRVGNGLFQEAGFAEDDRFVLERDPDVVVIRKARSGEKGVGLKHRNSRSAEFQSTRLGDLSRFKVSPKAMARRGVLRIVPARHHS